ncbi:MAG TPA: glycosyltransferase family 4 protein [Candidatus Angelobacter sp.]
MGSRIIRPEILYIVAGIEPWRFFGDICRKLHGRNYNFTFLFLHPDESLIAVELKEEGVPCHHIRFSKRLQVPTAMRKIFHFCRQQHFDVVHAHFVNACLSGLPGSHLAGIKIRIHTRHHCSPHPYSGRVRRQALYDQINNRFSTAIIAPCDMVRRRLMDEGVHPNRIELIHHGFDLDSFHNVAPDRIQRIAEQYGIRSEGPVIGASARFVPTKGVQHIVEAFQRLLSAYPKAQLVLANARGKLAEVRAGLSRLPPGSHLEIPYEMDNSALYHLFDIFVHVPVAGWVEGFGQVYVEAMAAGIPSVFTKAGIAHELLRHGENSWVVDYESPDQIHKALLALLSNPALCSRLSRQARADVEQEFGLDQHASRLANFYDRLLGVPRRTPIPQFTANS